MTTVLILSMPPTSNNLFSGNGKRRYRSAQYKAWSQEAGWELARQRPAKVLGQVSILIQVEEPKTERQTDLANREKATIDLLVEHGIIEGDRQRYVRRLTMEWADVTGVKVSISSVV